MGLFDKKYCDICGEKIGLLGNRKLEDGNLCKDCARKLSPFFSERRNSTVEDIKRQLKFQTIGHDKVNQLRHVRFFRNIHGMVEHMRRHADIIRPKFEAVEEILERELGGLGIGEWTMPKGGYFISFDSLDGCAKAIVARCKKAGLVMTGAGATYPYGKDPHDTNIRIAPSYPPLSDLILAMDLFALCTKIVSIDKILKDRAEAQEAPEQA